MNLQKCVNKYADMSSTSNANFANEPRMIKYIATTIQRQIVIA